MKTYLLSFLISLLLSLVLTPFMIYIAKKFNITDRPNERKIHKKAIPVMGGIPISIAFFLTCFITLNLTKEIAGILIGSMIIVLCGVLDDKKDLNYKTKLLFQIISALILTSHNVIVTKISIPFINGIEYIDLGVFSIPITLIWVIGVINAINLIDGLDGLASGLVSISGIFLFIVFILTGNLAMAVLAISLSGACLGFLPYNFNQAKIFMGDTGSMFLGFILAAISIQGTAKYATTIIVFIPILIIGLPLYDTIVTIIRRVAQKKSIMSPDRQHFHHRMLSFGFNQKQVALLSYFINFIFGTLAILILFIKDINTSILVVITSFTVIFIFLENYIFTKKQKKQKKTKLTI